MKKRKKEKNGGFKVREEARKDGGNVGRVVSEMEIRGKEGSEERRRRKPVFLREYNVDE